MVLSIFEFWDDPSSPVRKRSRFRPRKFRLLDGVACGQTRLVVMADAAVVVWDDRDPGVRRILALVERKGIPVHVIGAPVKQKVKRVRDPEAPEPRRRGMLPD
jgi:hypothetical protein